MQGIKILRTALELTMASNVPTKTTAAATKLPDLPSHWHSLAHAVVFQCRAKSKTVAVKDSLGTSLTYEQLLIASIALAQLLSQRLGDASCVGILLPPSVGACIANLAVSMLGRLPVNLNYTFTQPQLDHCIVDCHITHVISTERVLKRVSPQQAQIIKLEDVKEDATLLTKVSAWMAAEWVPQRFLGHLLPGLIPYKKVFFPIDSGNLQEQSKETPTRLDDPATIIFTTGSTADPKGVVLSHSNILSNIYAIKLQGQIEEGETVMGVIPYFHSFGLTMTLWAPLCLGETAIYHYDPLDAKKIGDLCSKHRPTTLVCTPTMMSLYLKRNSPEVFSSIRSFILGGEKLSDQQFNDLKTKLGKSPLQGYGLAETSPVVSSNVPGTIVPWDGSPVEGTREGTVGTALPGTAVKITDLESGEELPFEKEGLIWIKGPQVMMGYINKPELTSDVIQNGWFKTGDVGLMDRDGFLRITGRLSQFSKISGEMVPHLGIEDAIKNATGLGADDVSVTCVPDAKRGERLIVIHSSNMTLPSTAVVELLRKSGLPNLWIPASDDFVEVDSLPIMASGKKDLRAIKALALQFDNAKDKPGKIT